MALTFSLTNLTTSHAGTTGDPLAGRTFEIVGGITGVTPVINNGAAWFDQAFVMEDVLAVYPNCILLDCCYPGGDGGLPKDQVIPSVLLATGGSGNVTAGSKKLESMLINDIKN